MAKLEVPKEFLEKLTTVAHEQWIEFIKYVLSIAIKDGTGFYYIPQNIIEEWERQMKSGDCFLFPTDRELMRGQAKRILGAIFDQWEIEKNE